MMERSMSALRDGLLDAAEAVVARQGIANLTLDAVAAEAGLSKGGLLHHFPTKDKLVEGMVMRSAEQWRATYTAAIEHESPGPGRVSRALLGHCLADGSCWTDELRRSSSAVFAALAQNPSLIEPMRVAYAELHRRVADDGLPEGLGDVVVAAIDGLWLNWVLGLVPVSQERIVRVRKALSRWLATVDSSRTTRKAKAGKAIGAVHRPPIETHRSARKRRKGRAT
jgi:AcrR family transcriptional regulator